PAGRVQPAAARPRVQPAQAPAMEGEHGWRPLMETPTSTAALQLEFCLPTGQTFRWRRTGDGQFTGVVGTRLLCLRQHSGDVSYRVLARGAGASEAGDALALHDYFNLGTSLEALSTGWAASCERYRRVSPYFPGARMLRQDPVECLYQFLCSSNNHISRIQGMVERLCSAYGTPLTPEDAAAGQGAGGLVSTAGDRAAAQEVVAPAASDAGLEPSASANPKEGGADKAALSFFAFPSLEQLSRATEEELREAGFGYRARYVVGTTQALMAKPGGGRQWLLSLRQASLEEAVAALTELPGIGPKVAACVCLFSLDKHGAIPVDTHVWQICIKYYRPQLRGKSLTKKVHAEVQQIFVDRFGPYAGWAHNTLFISELASQQHRLPDKLRQGGKVSSSKGGGDVADAADDRAPEAGEAAGKKLANAKKRWTPTVPSDD
ncbi:N-glycosylase/DNA lyase, partial [Tetrabaena socialis]